jgi:hypothetical protein
MIDNCAKRSVATKHNTDTLILLDSTIEEIDIGLVPPATGDHCCLY